MQMDWEKLPLEGAVGQAEEHGGSGHVLDSPMVKVAVRHLFWKT